MTSFCQGSAEDHHFPTAEALKAKDLDTDLLTELARAELARSSTQIIAFFQRAARLLGLSLYEQVKFLIRAECLYVGNFLYVIDE